MNGREIVEKIFDALGDNPINVYKDDVVHYLGIIVEFYLNYGTKNKLDSIIMDFEYALSKNTILGDKDMGILTYIQNDDKFYNYLNEFLTNALETKEIDQEIIGAIIASAMQNDQL